MTYELFVRIDVSINLLLLAVQMSQSGQLTLELPYVIIGLGSTPNFVEKITVGIPPNIESVCDKIFYIFEY
jgi:hypothetical protein